MYATAVNFSRTLRSLRADHSKSSLAAVLLFGALLATWVVWLFSARVAVYTVSEAARIETSRSSVAIQSVNSGRISRDELVLGKKVKKGDVLVELDANVQEMQLKEEQSQDESITSEIRALERQIAAERASAQEETRAAEVGLEEARVKLREGAAAAQFADAELQRQSTLDAEGLAPHSLLAKTRSDQERAKAELEGLRLAVDRQQRELAVQQSNRESRIQELTRQIEQLAGTSSRLHATVKRMQSEVQQRQIVAPVDGVIGEVANLPLGSVISAGQRLGAIVPDGSLKVVAQFDPAKSIGRIRQGQNASVRLQGFPWTQYGVVDATVTRVANEVEGGYIQVELKPASEGRIPLQHGLPGTAEIVVERLSPMALLLRLAGQSLASEQKTATIRPQEAKQPGAPAQ